jgi:hypothetical protein
LVARNLGALDGFDHAANGAIDRGAGATDDALPRRIREITTRL